MEQAIYSDLLKIWDYMHLGLEVTPCDCIVGFGNLNGGIPRLCAQLYREGYAPKILFSGGLGRNTQGRWQETEAERFAQAAIALGVPEGDILLEDRSTNTAENILFTRTKLEELGFRRPRLLCVHQPFMERRLYAALKVYWPEWEGVITSPQPRLEDYLAEAAKQGMAEHTALEVMVGDYQRMDLYAKKGYQIPMAAPESVEAAFQRLVKAGFGGQLAK